MEYFVFICLIMHELTQKVVVKVHFTFKRFPGILFIRKVLQSLSTEHSQT